MSSAPQTGGGGGDAGKRQALIGVNDLNYVLPPDLSVSVVRTHTNHYFQQSEYANTSRANCILNTGAHYIDMRHSSLEFGVRLQNRAGGKIVGGYFGRNGSALNLIESVTVSSRAGDELCRINQADLLHYVTIPFRNDDEFLSTVGQGMGFGDTCLDPLANRNTTFFSIPLSCLVDLFAYGRLFPSMLASGLRISITWATPQQAFIPRIRGLPAGVPGTFIPGTDGIQSYTIVNPYVSTFVHQLSDGVQRDLNELSATNGLELVYCDWEATQAEYPTSTKMTTQLEVRKAASRALQAIAVTRHTTDTNLENKDTYNTKEWDYRKWQWQLGSLYFPQQPVLASTDGGPTVTTTESCANSLSESYKHTLTSFGTYKGGTGSKRSAVPYRSKHNLLEGLRTNRTGDSVSLTPWRGISSTADVQMGYPGTNNNGDTGSYGNGMSVLGVTLERTDLFNLSGVPINNARVLSLRVEYDSAVTQFRTLTIFLKYVRLARCFLNNVEVEQ